MHYFVGDTPGTIPVVPSSLPLDGFTAASGTLTSPGGVVEAVPVDIAGDRLDVDLPMLEQVGMHTLHIVLTGADSERALPPARFPVEALAAEWHSIDSARAEWQGAPVDDAVLHDLLQVARTQCLAYAPAVLDVPTHYRAAQLLQARNVWNASRTDPSASTYGPDGYSVPVYPLDWTVKQLLRPQNPRPVVG